MTGPTAHGDKTRDTILSAATEVVLERGADAFSLREVARRANLAPSALYNHFPSRKAIVQAIALRALGELKDYLDVAPAGDSARDRLRELGCAYLAFARERPTEYRLIFDCLENPPVPWDVYLTVAEPFTLIVDACREGLASGELVDRADVGAGGMAYGLWALCHGHASLTARHLARVDGDFDSLALAAIDGALAGFSAAPSSAERLDS